ncbi:basic salivary proline-rich protein 4-like [Thalassophryne amazonica]|uniref:basic salivary proline-rich protein 4-like n=1 Tax=Thalassophryne amazonica TaxID=390379 RepID=UPI0014716640|nr:basic salivary proline-rich protein 4-like [Thalassophryne amazonica]
MGSGHRALGETMRKRAAEGQSGQEGPPPEPPGSTTDQQGCGPTALECTPDTTPSHGGTGSSSIPKGSTQGAGVSAPIGGVPEPHHQGHGSQRQEQVGAKTGGKGVTTTKSKAQVGTTEPFEGGAWPPDKRRGPTPGPRSPQDPPSIASRALPTPPTLDPIPNTKARDQKTARAGVGHHPAETTAPNPPAAANPPAPTPTPQRHHPPPQQAAGSRAPQAQSRATGPQQNRPNPKQQAEGEVRCRERATYTGPTGPPAQPQIQRRWQGNHKTGEAGSPGGAPEAQGGTNQQGGQGAREPQMNVPPCSEVPKPGKVQDGTPERQGQPRSQGETGGPHKPGGRSRGTWGHIHPGPRERPHSPPRYRTPTHQRQSRQTQLKRNDGRPTLPPRHHHPHRQ